MQKGLASRYDTFIFDWDGTLSSVKVLRLINERLNPYWAYKKKQSVENKKVRSTSEMRVFAPFFDMSVYLMRPKLHNDSKEVLQELKKRRKKIALFTNGARYRVEKELHYLGIEKYFLAVVSAQSTGALKPNPLGLQVTLKRIRARKERAIYIGDMVDDVVMAKYAKVASCAISGGFDSHSKLKAARPDYLFTSMEEFKKAL